MRIAMVALCAVLATETNADERRATIAMIKGDIVEGAFVRADANGLVVSIAGQEVRVPLAEVRYLSFVGRLGMDQSATAANSASHSADDDLTEKVIAGLRQMRAVTRIGVLYAQYSEEMARSLPPVMAFLSNVPEGTPLDAVQALDRAVSKYRRAGESFDVFRLHASSLFAEANGDAEYAERLLRNPELAEKQTDAVGEIAFGQTIKGRLGGGDAPLPEALGKGLLGSAAGAPSDAFRFTMAAPGKVRFMASGTVELRIMLSTAADELLASKQAGAKVPFEIRKDLPAGEYRLWVSTTKAYSGGEYPVIFARE